MKQNPQPKEEKKYLKVLKVSGEFGTSIEFGLIENPEFNNEVYIKNVAHHKEKESILELRVDEALLYIEGLSRTLNARITGLITKTK